MEAIAKAVAEKLNRYSNKKLVKFVIPKKGFSSLSAEGGALYDPFADQAFVALKNIWISDRIVGWCGHQSSRICQGSGQSP
jgi:uncharacterized protein (UPF0261 family)